MGAALLATLIIASPTPIKGEASYYNTGTITASGEPFDPTDLTCATYHAEIGDRLLVVAENGNRVTVRVNDRGPHVKGRIIDLSEAAMRELIDLKHGIIKVKVYRHGLR